MKKFYIFFIFVFFSNSEYIVKKFIGFGDSYPENDDSFVRTVPSNDPLISISQQAFQACGILLEWKEFQYNQGDSLVLIGYSQGGLVARLLYNICGQIRPIVKRIITVGTPNLGLDKISLMLENPKSQKKLNQNQRNQLIDQQNHQIQSQQQNQSSKSSMFSGFVNKVSNMITKKFVRPDQCPMVYLNQNGKTSELINELNLNTMKNQQLNQLDEEYQQLDYFISIGFSHDNVISPINSSLFGSEIHEIEEFDKEKFDIKKNTFIQIKTSQFNFEKEQIDKEIKEETDLQYKKELEQYLIKQEKKLQKRIRNFKQNVKLSVDKFNAHENTQKFVKKYVKFEIEKPTQQQEVELWEKFQQQFYDNFDIPFFNILQHLYTNQKFMLCAVSGSHMKFPDELFFVDEKVLSMQQILDRIATTEKSNELFEIYLEIFNCQMEKYRLIQLTKKIDQKNKNFVIKSTSKNTQKSYKNFECIFECFNNIAKT